MALDAHEFSVVVKARKGVLQPDLVNSIALKALTKEQAAAEGWTTYMVPQPCAAGHMAARYVANDLCTDCWRQRQGKEIVYPVAKNRTYKPGSGPRPAATANGAPVIVAPPAPIEPSKIEQRFLAELDSLRDFDAAATAVGWTRGLVESRASSNPVFKAALEDLISRRQIPRTLKAPTDFPWTDAAERNLIKHLVDSGLEYLALQAIGASPSEFYAHLDAAPAFRAAVENARPLAAETLRQRSLHAASTGNDRLLKILTDGAEDDPLKDMDHEQLNARMRRLLADLDKRGLLSDHEPQIYEHRVSGIRIDLNDYRVALDSQNHAIAPAGSNAENFDLVGGE